MKVLCTYVYFISKACTSCEGSASEGGKAEEVGHHLNFHYLLMTFQAKLLFVFVDSAV